MDAAQAALDAAYAMPVKDECDGCHGVKEAAIAEALRRIGLCEAAAEILDPARPAAAGSAGTAPAGPPGPRRGLPAGVRVHPQGRQAARLRPVDRRRKGAHVNAGPPRECTASFLIAEKPAESAGAAGGSRRTAGALPQKTRRLLRYESRLTAAGQARRRP